MKREYKIILLTYILLQLTSGIFISLIAIGFLSNGVDEQRSFDLATGIWLPIGFTMALIITLLNLRKEFNQREIGAVSNFGAIVWSILGVILVLLAQTVAIYIELWIGVTPGSENTEAILNMVSSMPIVMLVTSIIGPILEEIVFRKIIFGAVAKRFNIHIAAVFNSLLFAFAHMEFEHLLLYTAIGLTFTFLYVKTKRIIVPICSHILMNTVVVMQIWFL